MQFGILKINVHLNAIIVDNYEIYDFMILNGKNINNSKKIQKKNFIANFTMIVNLHQ